MPHVIEFLSCSHLTGVTANITALGCYEHPSSTLAELGINTLHVINPIIPQRCIPHFVDRKGTTFVLVLQSREYLTYTDPQRHVQISGTSLRFNVPCLFVTTNYLLQICPPICAVYFATELHLSVDREQTIWGH